MQFIKIDFCLKHTFAPHKVAHLLSIDIINHYIVHLHKYIYF